MTDPFALFDAWFAEAQASEPNDPNAMALATVGPFNRPSVRMVLLKGRSPNGFVFYTNREGRKAFELDGVWDAVLEDETHAALLFHWKSLRKQIRIEGRVERTSDAESDAYFASRSRDSQLGAWASDQSRLLDDRATFEARFADIQARFAGGDVPRPSHWGGYRVVPDTIEFWQDRAHRLHERRLFVRGDGAERWECDFPGAGGNTVPVSNDWTEGLLYP